MAAAALAQRSIAKKLVSKKFIEGGGFVVRRALGTRQLETLDPFLMLDHFGPIDVKKGEAVGAPDHPHRGFCTVSYMLEGVFEHRDSAGNSGQLNAGDVQWMTAGRGVVHSEMPGKEMNEKGGRMEGFQLWVNLPAKYKMTAPNYQDIASKLIPDAKSEDGKTTVRVIAGETLNAKGPVQTLTPIQYYDVKLQPNAHFVQPMDKAYNTFAYVYRGNGTVGDTEAQEGDFFVFATDGDALSFKSSVDSELRLLVCAGTPIGEPVVKYGPFVMNTAAEIQQAFADYQSGRMGEIEGAEERYAETARARRQRDERQSGEHS